MEPIKMEYKGVELMGEIKPYSKKERKMFIYFELNGTHYQNATLLPVGHTESQAVEALEGLKTWAHTVINENTK